MVIDLDFLVTASGTDISAYIVSMAYKTGICNPTGLLEIELSPNIDTTIEPYDTIIVYIYNTKVFTGYSKSTVLARRPVSQTLTCEDTLAKVRDTWITNLDWRSYGEPIEYWIQKFLDYSQVSSSVATGGPATPEKDWGAANAYQAIMELLKYVNWQMNVDASGVIRVQSHGIDEDDAIELTHILDYEHYTSDHWLRNRAIVLGASEEASVILDNDVEELEGEIRAAIVASGDIHWPGTAYLMAWFILNEFSTPWDVITVSVPGNPNIRLGETVHIVESWEDTDRYGLVTSWEWRINESDGYICVVTIDEKCMAFWLSDVPPDILYCATEGDGVWKTYNNGKNWFDISGEELTGTAGHAKDIHVIKGESELGTQDIVWAATLGGVFKTENGAPPWTNITDEYMDKKAQSIEWWGVLTDPGDADVVYCLGNYKYDVLRWKIYMYISEDGGETWASYEVNPYTGY